MATGGRKCILFLLLCSISMSLSQDVRMPPGLVTGPKTLIHYKETSNVTLHCVGVGNPSPAYAWTKNGQPLSLNADNIFQTPGVGTIIIYPCRSTDQGYYQCILTNTFGMTMSNMTFLQMATLQTFPPVIEITNYNVDINGHVCLACAKLASIPASQIYWMYNITGQVGLPIVITQTPSMQTNPFEGELCLTHVQTSDGAGSNNRVYICNAHNAVLSRTESGSYSRISTTSVTMASYAAFFTFGSAASLIVLEGDPLTLRAFFSGSPVPSLIWRKNAMTPPQSRWQVTNEGTGLFLTNGRLAAEDAGEFTCQGSNAIGSATHTIQLTVDARPIFLNNNFQPHDMNVTDGETVTMNCNPYAKPNATVVWYKNGAVFTASSLPPKFSLSVDSRTLTITGICKACNPDGTGDLMSIQCNASNVHGYGFAQGYLNVLVATAITSVGGSRVWTPYNNEVFDCQATSDDSTPVGRTWYYNDVIVQQSATVIVAANGSLVLLMQNETDGGQSRLGQYSCVASNGFSQAEVIYILYDGNVTTMQASTSTTGTTTVLVPQNCGNTTYYGPFGVISSLNYPGDYSNYQSCNYFVDTSSSSSSIAVIFTAFDTEQCCDYVTISCPSIPLYPSLTYSGSLLPQPFSIPRCSQAVVNFTTDGATVSTGFSLDYYVSLGGCGDTVYTESHDYVSSPNYPNSYGNNQNCSIIIWARLRSSFTITFLDMDLEECCDFVELSCLDNTEYGSHRFSGSSIPPKQNIPGCTQVLVWFHSDDSLVQPGFNLEYSINPDTA